MKAMVDLQKLKALVIVFKCKSLNFNYSSLLRDMSPNGVGGLCNRIYYLSSGGHIVIRQ